MVMMRSSSQQQLHQQNQQPRRWLHYQRCCVATFMLFLVAAAIVNSTATDCLDRHVMSATSPGEVRMKSNSANAETENEDCTVEGYCSGGEKTQKWNNNATLVRGGAIAADEKLSDTMSSSSNGEEHQKKIREDAAMEKEEKDLMKSPWAFSFHQPGDGSETDPDGIPSRYLAVQTRAVARAAVNKTLQWRKEKGMDTILVRPNPIFENCKELAPFFFVGRDKKGHVALYQQPAVIDLKRAEKNHVSNEDLLTNYVYFLEYLWNVLEGPQAVKPSGTDEVVPEHDALLTSLLDLTGLNLSLLRKRKLLNFVGTFLSTIDAHYPGRAHQTLLVNVPQWFGTLYKLIGPFLRDTTKEKIKILSRGPEQTAALRELFDEETFNGLPSILFEEEGDKKGKKNKKSSLLPEPKPMSKLEQDLRSFVRDRLADAGVEMKTLI